MFLPTHDVRTTQCCQAPETINAQGEGCRAAGLPLTHNFAWTLVGNVIYAACQWTIVVVLAKLGNADMVGEFALALAVAFPITLLANLQLRSLFVTDLVDKYPFGQMLGVRFALSAIAIAAVLLTCKLAGYGAQSSRVIILISLAQLVDCISENYYGISQRYDRMDRIAKSQMIRSTLSLVGFLSAIYFTRRLFWGMAGLVLGRVVVLLAYDAGRRTFALSASHSQAYAGRLESTLLERIRPQWNPKQQLQMIWVALPLGAVSIVNSLSANIPRYAIQHYLGRHELGIYSALNYIPTAGLMIATALGYAVFARLSRFYFVGDLAAFRRLVLRGSAICTTLGIFGLLASAIVGRQILAILYRPEYTDRVDILLWLMVVGAVGSVTSFLGCAMTAASQFRVQVLLFVGVAVSSATACLLLIPRLGLTGAAFAGLTSMVVQCLGTVLVISRGMANRARELRRDISVGLDAAVEL
jgi:O-antigen/teichoic acid export membrane protein